MRKKENINQGWLFSKEDLPGLETQRLTLPQAASVDIPHTWNQYDGQDGGNDYYRGACWYQKLLDLPVIDKTQELYLEFAAVNSVAKVYVNGTLLGTHAGGYSAFRVDLTEYAGQKDVLLCVQADNRDNEDVYPRTADYTFFGGIYRDVSLLTVARTHFAVNHYASSGIYIDAGVKDGKAEVTVRSMVENPVPGLMAEYAVLDADNECVAKVHLPWSEEPVVLEFETPHLWNGRKDPYLYTLRASLADGTNSADSADSMGLADETALDRLEIPFGVRSFSVDAEKGFFLNGESYPLHGVSRHQDRKDKGWAIGRAEHEEDIELICEIGATSVRLAHYQHDAYFYDLCDQRGLVVWAEIPFISQMSKTKGACENLRSQMAELICQNYNHPSICFWGLENETTIQNMESMKVDPDLTKMVQELHDMAKSLNPARLTCQACLGNVPGDSQLVKIPDLTSFNHYFGWYLGEPEDLAGWLDKFHQESPSICVGLSEYGGDGSIRYHSDKPKANDYTEDYQALLHEKLEAILDKRPFVWSHYVWNMFDFGSDRRDEGGAPGVNQKGLITYDRKVKKDAFYLYKAYWSEEPFVHICGHHYVDRVAKEREIKVYSNQPEVTLYLDGEKIASLEGSKVFCFTVNLTLGSHTLLAKAEDTQDELVLNGVQTYNKSYKMTDLEGKAGIVNWFENTDDFHFVSGTYSVNDRIAEILENAEAEKILKSYFVPVTGKETIYLAKNFKLAKMISKLGKAFPQELAVRLNDELSKIPKPADE